jgi:lipopolysaccharide transport system ATP-binding protein
VLAVGDAAFQKKCLGKMHEVARGGRTVLFVSHNMPTVLQICKEAVLLSEGRVVLQGSASEVTRQYLCAQTDSQAEVFDLRRCRRTMAVHHAADLVTCRATTPEKSEAWSFPYGSELALEIGVEVKRKLEYLELGLALSTATGIEIASSLSCDGMNQEPVAAGRHAFRVSYPSLTLRPGRYYFGFGLRSEFGFEDYISEAVYFDVLPTVESANKNVHLRLGAVIPELRCTLTQNVVEEV